MEYKFEKCTAFFFCLYDLKIKKYLILVKTAFFVHLKILKIIFQQTFDDKSVIKNK